MSGKASRPLQKHDFAMPRKENKSLNEEWNGKKIWQGSQSYGNGAFSAAREDAKGRPIACKIGTQTSGRRFFLEFRKLYKLKTLCKEIAPRKASKVLQQKNYIDDGTHVSTFFIASITVSAKSIRIRLP